MSIKYFPLLGFWSKNSNNMPFLTQGNTNWKFLLIVIVLAVIVGAGVWSWRHLEEEPVATWPPPNIVKEPGEGGQWVIVDELVILTSGQDIESLITDFNGEITINVPQTGTYQVKFPVSSLEELDIIAEELRKKESGIQVMRAIVMPPPILF